MVGPMRPSLSPQSRLLAAALGFLLALPGVATAASPDPAKPIDVGSRLELLVDRHLVDRLDNARFAPAHPVARETVFRFDQPWEEANGAFSVLKDGESYRLYYRGGRVRPSGRPYYVTCVAESRDGIRWTRPVLGLCEFNGSRLNNIILLPDSREGTTNFCPMLDTRPGVPDSERYKAVGGSYQPSPPGPDGRPTPSGGGLYRYVSSDGIHWRLYSDEALFVGYALDTLNIVEWLPEENVYAIYLRTWSEGGTPERPGFAGVRTISRSVSKDFVTWSKPEPMSFGDAPLENLYTNGTHPYFRAPHILVAFPFRFMPDRKVLSDDELNAFGVRKTQRIGTSDTVFMTSRGGTRYDRTILESYIRPGLDRRNWHARNNKAAKGVLPTGDSEMSIYVATHNTLPSSHLTRYTLPLDRFVSINAPYSGGDLLTKPLRFAGNTLVINYSTSAAGSIRVELLDAGGRTIPGFGTQESDEIVGDEIERTVTWRGQSRLPGTDGAPIRLRFFMKDADLFALRFRAGN